MSNKFVHYHIKMLQDYKSEIDEFLVKHDKCPVNWEEDCSPMEYNIKHAEISCARLIIVTCDRCGTEKIFGLDCV